MRIALTMFLASLFALPLAAQQQTTIQMQCHDLASTGNYVAPGETIIGTQACHPVQVPGSSQFVAQPTANTAPTAAPAPAPAPAAMQPKPVIHCVVLKRMGPADEVTSHMYSFGLRGKQFQYVEGELPDGVKFHGRLTDNDVRQIQSKGGHVVIMEPKYTESDLKEAKQSCEQSD
jgi:hypothetical protein